MASAVPIKTGVMAPVSVLGRAANIHACNELRFTASILLYIIKSFDGQRYMIFRIFTPPKTSNYRESMEKIEEICKED